MPMLIESQSHTNLLTGLEKRPALLTDVKTPGTISSNATDSIQDVNEFHIINSDNLKNGSQLTFQNESTGGSDFDLLSVSTCELSVHSTKSESLLSFGKEEEGVYAIKTMSIPSSVTTLDQSTLEKKTGNDSTKRTVVSLREQQKAEETAQRALDMTKALCRQEKQMLCFCAITILFIVALLLASAYICLVSSTHCPDQTTGSSRTINHPKRETSTGWCDKSGSSNCSVRIPRFEDTVFGHFQLFHTSDQKNGDRDMNISSSKQYSPGFLWNNSVDVLNGTVRIRKCGRYFVYSQVVFLNSEGTHQILQNGRTIMELDPKNKMSFISGFMRLKENDRLKVRVSERVDENKRSAFVGVYML